MRSFPFHHALKHGDFERRPILILETVLSKFHVPLPNFETRAPQFLSSILVVDFRHGEFRQIHKSSDMPVETGVELMRAARISLEEPFRLGRVIEDFLEETLAEI